MCLGLYVFVSEGYFPALCAVAKSDWDMSVRVFSAGGTAALSTAR